MFMKRMKISFIRSMSRPCSYDDVVRTRSGRRRDSSLVHRRTHRDPSDVCPSVTEHLLRTATAILDRALWGPVTRFTSAQLVNYRHCPDTGDKLTPFLDVSSLTSSDGPRVPWVSAQSSSRWIRVRRSPPYSTDVRDHTHPIHSGTRILSPTHPLPRPLRPRTTPPATTVPKGDEDLQSPYKVRTLTVPEPKTQFFYVRLLPPGGLGFSSSGRIRCILLGREFFFISLFLL